MAWLRNEEQALDSLKLWQCVAAVGLAGFGLAVWVSHAHGDEHHHHTHEHRHGNLTHTHHHSHDADEGHDARPTGGESRRPCGGDDHHCCMDHGQPDAADLTLPPRETRRQSELDTVAADVPVFTGRAFLPEAWTPPRAPPWFESGQDALPQLRTIVLLT